MEMVAIVSRRPTLLHLPPVVIVEKDATGQDRPDTGVVTTLMPGGRDNPKVTEVPEAVWERASKHRTVKEWLRLGWIRVATKEDTSPGVEVVDISAMSPASALACIETEEVRATLDGWLKADERVVIKNAITTRLSILAKKK